MDNYSLYTFYLSFCIQPEWCRRVDVLKDVLKGKQEKRIMATEASTFHCKRKMLLHQWQSVRHPAYKYSARIDARLVLTYGPARMSWARRPYEWRRTVYEASAYPQPVRMRDQRPGANKVQKPYALTVIWPFRLILALFHNSRRCPLLPLLVIALRLTHNYL